MNEEPAGHRGNPETEFEHQDLSPKGVFAFLLGLAIVCVIVYFALIGMYRLLDKYEARHQTPPNPLATNVQTETAARQVPADARMKFPEPRLEVSERSELKDFRLDEENRLNSYGWVDQKAGVVRIPIDRAMQLIAQRGLPVRPPSAASAPVAGIQPKSGQGVKPEARTKTTPSQ